MNATPVSAREAWVGGMLFFAFIPITLFLFLYLPLGHYASLILGLAIIAGHRRVAMPWVARRRRARCLWCGTTKSADLEPIPLRVGREVQDYHACADHTAHVRRFAGLADRHRPLIAAGIFVPLGSYLLVMLVAPLIPGVTQDALHDGLRHLFRGGIGLTCFIVSFAHRAMPDTKADLSFPFPLHNLALLGIRTTLWIFRIVGAWWVLLTLWLMVRG